MEHADATSNQITERYLLDELTETERDAFEEHYFDCAECAADVRAAAKVMAAGRQIARETSEARVLRPKRGWPSWFPQAAAAAVILLALGWFASTQSSAPQGAIVIERDVAFSAAQTRDAADTATAATQIHEREQIDINIDDIYHREAASYVIRVRNAAGKEFFSAPVSAEQAQDTVTVRLPQLPNGSYRVVVEGVRKDGNRLLIADKHAFDVVGQR